MEMGEKKTIDERVVVSGIEFDDDFASKLDNKLDSRMESISVNDYYQEDDDVDWEVDPEAVRKLVEKYKGEEFPLFMGDETLDSNNPHVQALQALVYDDETPESLARQFRIVGNEYFQDGKTRYKDAVIAYSKGIEQKSADKETNSLLYSNRAHIYLIMKRYVDCVDDCRASLRENPENIKAAYRGCVASMRMHLYKQALSFALHGLKYEQDNQELKQLKLKLEERLREISDRKKLRDMESRNCLQESEKSLAFVLADRGYILGEPIYDVVHTYSHGIKLLMDKMEILYPILILLDEPMLCEFICEANENSTLEDHMRIMFPGNRTLPWDEEGRYSWNNVCIFYEPGPPNDGIVWEVFANKSLKQVIDVVKYIPKVPVFHIISKDSACLTEFITISYKVIRDPSLCC